MSIFDDVGAVNAPDAGGDGAMPVPPPRSLPSVAQPPQVPAPQQEDPRYAAALAALQPKQVPGWQQALRSIAPILGTLLASRQNAGGAFMQAWQHGEQQSQNLADEESRRQLNIATILHQQQQERQASANARLVEQRRATAEAAAAKKLEVQAQKEETNRREKLLRDEWTSQSGGGLIDVINDLIKNQGPEAADQYMQSTHIGALTDQGVPHTVKDLVDRYAVKGPDGSYIGGKTKTQKEVTAGTQEDYVTRAERMATQQRGRALTDAETQAIDDLAIKRYKGLSKDPDAAEMTRTLKQLQIDLATQEKERRQQVIDKGYQDQYGGAPQIFQHEDGTIHGYVYDKTNHQLVEIPTVIPPGSSRIQPPSAWSKFLKSIGVGGSTPSPAIKPLSGGSDPTDPNWGKP